MHCVKNVHIRSYFGSYFPEFRLNMERYSISIRIQSECGKMLTRITPNTDTFHVVVLTSAIFFIGLWNYLKNSRQWIYAIWSSLKKWMTCNKRIAILVTPLIWRPPYKTNAYYCFIFLEKPKQEMLHFLTIIVRQIILAFTI